MASYATSARFLQIVNWAHRLAGMHMSNYEQLLHIELAFLEAKNVSSHMGVPWHHSCHFLSLPVMFCVFNHWKQFSLCEGVLNNRTWMTAHRCIVLSIFWSFWSEHPNTVHLCWLVTEYVKLKGMWACWMLHAFNRMMLGAYIAGLSSACIYYSSN